MAAQARILATIVGLGGSTGMLDTQGEVLIAYHCTGPVSGAINGQVALKCDVTQNESSIKNELSTALAAYLDPLIFPSQGYTTNDVRGLNV
jgi:hypothetical protein